MLLARRKTYVRRARSMSTEQKRHTQHAGKPRQSFEIIRTLCELLTEMEGNGESGKWQAATTGLSLGTSKNLTRWP